MALEVGKQRKESEHRREQAIVELITSESKYNAHLSALVQNYAEPFKDYKILNKEQHHTLFSQIYSIKKLSDNLTSVLIQRRVGWNASSSNISDIFGSLTPYFTVFHTHADAQGKAMELMLALQTNKKYMAHCQRVRIHETTPLSECVFSDCCTVRQMLSCYGRPQIAAAADSALRRVR